jgi:single-strand DNA-binding protein
MKEQIHMDTNTITVTGNVTNDPTVRFLPKSGKAVANFDVAVNRRWLNKATNEWESDTTFLGVTVYDRLAENIGESIGKGDRVTVTGRLSVESWEKDGQPRTKTVIVANDVSLSLQWATGKMTRNPKNENGNGGGNYTAPAASAGNDYSEEPF